MTSRLARVLAMAAAVLVLACVLAWVLDGAPNVPDVNFFMGSAESYIGHQDLTITAATLWMLSSAHRWGSYVALLIIAISIASAASLSLLSLVRGGSEAIRLLGVGLAAWSLSIGYLYFFSALRLFDGFVSWNGYLRVGLDVMAAEVLLVSSWAFVRFWQTFPRPVSREELARFRTGVSERSSWLTAASRRDLGGITSHLARVPSAVWVALSIGTTMLIGLGIRLDAIDGNPFVGWAIFGLPVLLFFPGVWCLRLLQFHRVAGDAEDRRKIEWIWAAMWGWVVLMLLPGVVMPFWLLAERWFPELAFEHGLIGTYLVFIWMCAPLVFIAALAMSILYRGSFDPRLALRGFTVWTLLSVVLTLIFVFVERTVALRLVGWWHLPPQTGFVTAGALVAATFQPVRRYAERNVTRFVERVLPTSLLVSGKRMTVAVGIVDISGYSALSAADEPAALLASALVQKEARRLADRHHGRVVKSTGDGVILCFESADSALAASQELHRTVTSGAAALNIAALKLHSGLHWGEVVEMHDADIYGQTVNVAARIADWAQAGEIGLSDAFRVALATAPAGLEAAGPQAFKNVPQRVICYRLADT